MYNCQEAGTNRCRNVEMCLPGTTQEDGGLGISSFSTGLARTEEGFAEPLLGLEYTQDSLGGEKCPALSKLV